MNYQGRKFLIGIVFLSVVLRMAAAFFLGDQVTELPGIADQVSYHTLALRVLGGHGFSFAKAWWPATAAGAPTAHWSFLYTFFLVAVYALFGPHPLAARILQALIVGILQPFLTYRLTRSMFGRYTASAPWIGLLAAALTAIYTYFIYYSAALMTEAFYNTAVLACLYLSILLAEKDQEWQPQSLGQRAGVRLAIFLGFALIAAVLLRQLIIILAPFFLFWIGINNRRRIPALAISVLMLGGSILPITLYNQARFHRFVMLNTNAGYVMYWANHPSYGTHFVPILPPEEYLELIPRELLTLDEAALDQALLRLGLKFIVDDPQRFLLLSLSRVPVYFQFWPSSEDGMISNISRVAGYGLSLPLILYGLIRSVLLFARGSRRGIPFRASPLLLVYFFGCAYTVIHLLTWALVRYRLPVDAAFMSFGGLALFEAAGWLTAKARRKDWTGLTSPPQDSLEIERSG